MSNHHDSAALGGPNLAELKLDLVDFGPNLAKFGPNVFDSTQMPAKSGPKLVDFGTDLTNLGPSIADACQTWAEMCRNQGDAGPLARALRS